MDDISSWYIVGLFGGQWSFVDNIADGDVTINVSGGGNSYTVTFQFNVYKVKKESSEINTELTLLIKITEIIDQLPGIQEVMPQLNFIEAKKQMSADSLAMAIGFVEACLFLIAASAVTLAASQSVNNVEPGFAKALGYQSA